jgi:transcriptional regulator with XRE-family HTH domain
MPKKGMNKREFAKKLIDLKPTINRIGEIPSQSAIYAYLSGTTSIKAELIPFIAEVLDVTEQELFDTTKNTRKRCFKYFVENAQKDELEYFNSFINTQINHAKVIMNSTLPNNKVKKLSNF